MSKKNPDNISETSGEKTDRHSVEKSATVIQMIKDLTGKKFTGFIKINFTRAGEGTIDTPYLGTYSNGLAYLISRFINEEFFCYLNLKRSARSALAERSEELL